MEEMKALTSIEVGQDFWQGASAQRRHLVASLKAPLSVKREVRVLSKLSCLSRPWTEMFLFLIEEVRTVKENREEKKRRREEEKKRRREEEKKRRREEEKKRRREEEKKRRREEEKKRRREEEKRREKKREERGKKRRKKKNQPFEFVGAGLGRGTNNGVLPGPLTKLQHLLFIRSDLCNILRVDSVTTRPSEKNA